VLYCPSLVLSASGLTGALTAVFLTATGALTAVFLTATFLTATAGNPFTRPSSYLSSGFPGETGDLTGMDWDARTSVSFL